MDTAMMNALADSGAAAMPDAMAMPVTVEHGRLAKVADAINVLGAFCGPRDVPQLTQQAMHAMVGGAQADAMVLFGGSILCGVDVLAEAIRNQVARRYIIVGGAGHTTQTLRDVVHGIYPDILVDNEPEARIFRAVLQARHEMGVDWLEVDSTNCGNNITYLLDLLKTHDVDCRSAVLVQDATMQRRMAAGLNKYAPNVTVVNYASYRVKVVADVAGAAGAMDSGWLRYESVPEGMWPVKRYVTLLMGEVARLTDDEGGYGPNGKGYIAHVEVPPHVAEAAAYVTHALGDMTRKANPTFASR